ncbi:MAG TPA: response regulator [Calditrichia bacterium]|nr:response regulator [Calditrichota bacterium]HQU73062.1 response regulator [Calditrichia bacterium]HQV31097.1 response regulator [Calditrichia bacterium]
MAAKSILIVDDDHQVRKMLGRALTGKDYQVVEACNGIEALKVFQQLERQLNLIIMDIIMPEKEGIETIREIRQKNNDVKILAISGGSPRLGAHISLKLAQTIGANHILEKPFAITDLLRTVEELA